MAAVTACAHSPGHTRHSPPQPDDLSVQNELEAACAAAQTIFYSSRQSQPSRAFPVQQQQQHTPNHPVESGKVPTSLAALQHIPSLPNAFNWDIESDGPPESRQGLGKVHTVVPPASQSCVHGYRGYGHDMGSPCAPGVDSCCSKTSQKSDGLGFLPGMSFLSQASDEDPGSYPACDIRDVLEHSRMSSQMPSLALRDTENHPSDSPPSSPPSSPTESPPSTPPCSPPCSPPSGGFRQKLSAPPNGLSSSMHERRKLQLRAPLAMQMQMHARNACCAHSSGFPSYLAHNYPSQYSQFPRPVPTIPEDTSVSGDSNHSDTMHDDLDCVSGSFGSMASGDPVHECVGAGTQVMQGGSLVFVPPDRDGAVGKMGSDDNGAGAGVCCGGFFGILSACCTQSFHSCS